MSRFKRSTLWMGGALALLIAGPAQPQGNIDAGKTPAQMFSDVCTNCHRRPQDLRRGASASFLRQHYMPGSQEAAAMASYLASLPSDPRGKDRGKDKTAKGQQPSQQQANDKKAPPAKGKRAVELAKGAPEPSEPAENMPDQPESEASVPKLEPFEE